MAKATETTTSAALEAATRLNNKEVEHREKKRMSLVDQYAAEKKIVVQGAPMYRAQFGNNMPISLNGILVTVPLDGNRYEIPESFANIFNARLRATNEQLDAQKRMSDVKNNSEKFPGELGLVRQV